MNALGFLVTASTSLIVLFVLKPYAVDKYFDAFSCSIVLSLILFDPLLLCVMKFMSVRDVTLYRTGTDLFGDITFRHVLSHVMGFSMAFIWLYLAVTVPHPDSITFYWVTQDIFGSCLCILFARFIKLNSIRVAAILLIVAFFYDIFFVFVTPFLTGGKSVMITVVTSGGPPTADSLWCEKYPSDPKCAGGDPFSMLLIVPRIGDYQGGSRLLGLGDIVLPGLLLSFSARVDTAKALLGVIGGGRDNSVSTTKRVVFPCWYDGYFPPLVVAYAVGLLMSTASVDLMRMDQPALLYLVPCCLGTIVYVGWKRNELQDLWDGPHCIRAVDDIIHGPVNDTQNVRDHHVPLPSSEDIADLGVPAVPSATDENDDDSESRSLLEVKSRTI
jgi:signal peptide peptidase-like 2B